MRVLLESVVVEVEYPNPIDVDSSELLSVEVYREWRHLDLVISIQTLHQGAWIIVIENKIEATQRKHQLWDYRKRVQQFFPNAQKLVYVFLTKNREEPEDKRFISANYQQVYETLRDCVAERSDTIGLEPKVLIEHYLETLAEVFMEESEVAKLAKRIYASHKRALDLIFEHRPDALADISRYIDDELSARAETMNIVPMALNKGLVRFLPKEWNTPENRKGTAWGKAKSAFILFELVLWAKTPRLTVAIGDPPDAWGQLMWNLASDKPFRVQRRSKQPGKWIIVHSVPARIPLDDLDDADIEDLRKRITDWIEKEYGSPTIQEVLRLVNQKLEDLQTYL